jgi:hypothetical protein
MTMTWKNDRPMLQSKKNMIDSKGIDGACYAYQMLNADDARVELRYRQYTRYHVT